MVPSMIVPAKPLTFCGLSLSWAVREPVCNAKYDPVHEDLTTHVEPASTTTSESIFFDDSQKKKGLSKLYRPVDPARTHVELEQASAAMSMVNDSGLNSQEQGLPKSYRPVDPAARVEPEETRSEIGDEEMEGIEEVKREAREVGDSGM